jgi:hypothetical protein
VFPDGGVVAAAAWLKRRAARYILMFRGNFSIRLLQKLPPPDNISAMSKVNKKLKAAAEKADLDWKDAMSKLEQIPWKIAAVPAKTLTKVSASTDPKAIIRQILAKNFPYAAFESVFGNHRFASDANVILQERMLEAISKKYPSLKAACKIYFK